MVDRIRAATDGGADCAIETVGNAAVLAQAYAATRRGGTTITVGLPHPDRMLTIPAVSLAAEERTLRGSYLGSSVPVRDVPRFIDHYRAGQLPVEQLLTHRLGLDEINEGFDRLARGRGGAAGRRLLRLAGQAKPRPVRSPDEPLALRRGAGPTNREEGR